MSRAGTSRDFGSGIIPTQVPVSSSRPTVPGLDYWEQWVVARLQSIWRGRRVTGSARWRSRSRV
jgi:hypothetical protein